MASVFLSYDRDDGSRARHFAQLLEGAGHEVWWDMHVRGGAQFSKVIEQALAAADVIVVLWSKNSVESAWVRDEASAGRDTGRLIPVTIDETAAPIGFRQFQSIDLSRWKGHGSPPQLQMFLADVDAMAKGENATDFSTEPRLKRPRFAGRNWRIAGGIVAAAAGAAAIFAWSPWHRPASSPTVLVTAGRNDLASEGLARDFAVQLGSLSSVQSGSLRLITSSRTPSDKPALVLEITNLAQPQTSGASLLLRNSTDNSLIWSHDFKQEQRSIADMRLQMAYSAARVLGCAADAIAGNGSALSGQTRALYLTLCGQTVEEGDDYDPQKVAVGLAKVVADVPAFTPAWRKLVLADAEVLEGARNDQRPIRAFEMTLGKHIADARKLDPEMPEATVAEISLVPRADLITRMRLIDQAYRQAPENPAVLMSRTLGLLSVGRMSEATFMAVQASQIDPTSPEALSNYIGSLAYGGRIEMAEQQLKRAESLWPGTTTLDDLKWRFYLRFGDPKVALQMAQNRTMPITLQMFVEARANPTKENVDKLISFYTARSKADAPELPSLDFVAQAFGQFHKNEELYAMALRWPDQQALSQGTEIWFRPALNEFRRDPRFMELMARTPLLKYWRSTSNWPDFCKEPDLPYDCEKEAAKYKV